VRKTKARKQALDARKSLDAGQVEEKSAAIFSRLRSLPALAGSGPVLSYVSSKDNEVDTLRVITWLLEQDRVVLVPIALAGGTLDWSRLLSLGDLSRGRFDILEPRPDRRRIEVPPPGAAVVVPGIAFRPDGYRIGYGGGYFDRFLTAHLGLRVGLAFDIQIVESFVPDPHDVPMDYVVTESRVFERA
jgi:5-formyltetrahydrofolate cyclo-ligase